jgi:stearoyl-CoA desaturase (delta-9 desaturase)
MAYVLLCIAVFSGTYLLSLSYITVVYHRGFAHGAVAFAPGASRWLAHLGNWITGMDVKAWTCMHRRHHLFADTPLDPHSPHYGGTLRLFHVQLRSYKRAIGRLLRGDADYVEVVRDLQFEVNWLNRNRLWYAPYVLHLLIGLAIGWFGHAWALGLAYSAGIMSHPLQGWLVNCFGHLSGTRNFDTPDRSTNNTAVAWLVMGEGYQNNHHRYPRSAKFSYRPSEVDLGYALCRVAHKLGWLEIRSEGMIPNVAPAGDQRAA